MLSDYLSHDPVDRIHDVGEHVLLEDPLRSDDRKLEHPAHVCRGIDDLRHLFAQRCEQRRAFVNAEHDSQDHLQGELLHSRRELEWLVDRPGSDLALGDLLHERHVPAHPVAVERRKQQLALAEVIGTVEKQHGVLPHERE